MATRWLRPRPQPSRTSQAVATVRSTLPRPHTPDGDPQAQAKLCRGMRMARSPWLYTHLAARTRFFDDHVLRAIEGQIGQIVILGAGYDDRALRFRSRGVRYFEVDHPDTQTDKRQRLGRMGADLSALVLVAGDFRVDSAADILHAHDHDQNAPSLFICEGLLVYLDRAAIVELLSALRSRAAGGSRLAVSLAVHQGGVDSDVVAQRANSVRVHGAAEPWRTILPPAEHLDLLARSGWSAVETYDDATVDNRARPGRSLLVSAVPWAASALPI